jgi:uncharacterized protein
MKKTVCILIFIVFQNFYFAQLASEKNTAYIEVNGLAETEVLPDEIFVSITLMERPENKEKLSINKQEDNLKQALKDIGIELSNLSLSEAYADFRKLKTLKKDVIISKTYSLKVSSASQLSKVYEKLDKINAYDAFVSKISHSKIEQLTKENRIKALKAAKDKVDYMLAAVGQKAGQALYIFEAGSDVYNPFVTNYRMTKMLQANYDGSENTAQEEIEFKKIKITSTVQVRYEILNAK